jgi:hypothetical protein
MCQLFLQNKNIPQARFNRACGIKNIFVEYILQAA